MRKINVIGATVSVDRADGGTELHRFESEAEAIARAAFVAEALSWVGTPFRDCADIKGREGAVDCAMLLVRCSVDTGLLAPFDPRPYAPRWHVHRGEEKFLDWVKTRLGGVEVERPIFGDVVVWQFGRCFSHGAILVNSTEVVHAWAAYRMVTVSPLDEPLLRFMGSRVADIPRPVKFFDVWRGQN